MTDRYKLQIPLVSFFLLLAVSVTIIMFTLDADNVSDTIRQSDNTIRVDPLDHFEKYRGGFNITNKHYWSVNLSPFFHECDM